MASVFLSASIPLPDRHPRFMKTADVLAIRESVKGLVLVLLETKNKLVFGGHPAITPLVRLLLQDAGVSPREHVRLYLSHFFVKDFPPETADFEEVVVVDAVQNDREKSLDLMRRRMIGEEDLSCGIFIGGMEGIIDEFELFRTLKPEVPLYPIASTGAAAAELFARQKSYPAELAEEITYPTLFRKLIRDNVVL